MRRRIPVVSIVAQFTVITTMEKVIYGRDVSMPCSSLKVSNETKEMLNAGTRIRRLNTNSTFLQII